MSKRDKNLYLQDIVDCIVKISKYTNKLTFADFAKEPIIIDAVIRNLEIIGEAAKNIPQEYKSAPQSRDWRKKVQIMACRQAFLGD
ncbi:toxin-antitoxin system antitoxin subunit [bacterium]|nr:toxin-antitoxin system antitoxin subunit [bacterium]